jgi:hypothetical protein
MPLGADVERAVQAAAGAANSDGRLGRFHGHAARPQSWCRTAAFGLTQTPQARQ